MNLPPPHSWFQRRRTRRGMVLLEVLTALVVFTLVAFSLIMALDAAFDAAEERNQVDKAIRGLDNQIELLHSARVLPGETDAPDDGTGISYHISVEQVQMNDQKGQPVPNMLRATISAKWTMHNKADERDVSELVYQP
jgi:predicted PurR-regulated permease PerM